MGLLRQRNICCWHLKLEDEKVKSSNEINDEERQSNSMIALKDLLQHKNYVVVLDANILLKIYRSSPDYAEFVLECLDSIKGDPSLNSLPLYHKKNKSVT